jgi:hypothetical protein
MKSYGRQTSAAEKIYAKQHGWKPARFEASLDEIAAGRRNSREEICAYDQLGSLYDHAEWYDWAGTQQPAAIIVHPYGHITQQEIEAIAQRYGLRVQIIKPSWHSPEATTIVFSAPREGAKTMRRRNELGAACSGGGSPRAAMP